MYAAWRKGAAGDSQIQKLRNSAEGLREMLRIFWNLISKNSWKL